MIESSDEDREEKNENKNKKSIQIPKKTKPTLTTIKRYECKRQDIFRAHSLCYSKTDMDNFRSRITYKEPDKEQKNNIMKFKYSKNYR